MKTGASKEKNRENTNRNDIRKSSSGYRFLHFYRNRVMNILIFFVILVYLIGLFSYNSYQELSRCYTLLSDNIKQVEHYQQYEKDANDLYIKMQDQDYLSACQLGIQYMEQGMSARDFIDFFNGISDDFDSIFYLKSDGSLISYKDRDPLVLSEEDRKELLEKGSLDSSDSQVRYYSIPYDEDYVIVRIDEAYAEQFSMDILKFTALDGFIYNNDTLDITEADESEIPSGFDEMYCSGAIKNRLFTDPNTTIVLISPYKSGLTGFMHLKLAAITPLSYPLEGYSICTYIPVSEIIGNVLIKGGLPGFLCLVFIFLNIFGSLYFREAVKNRKGSNTQKNRKIRLPGNCYLDLETTAHIQFMQLFLGVLVILCSAVMLIVSRFCACYENTKYSIEQLVETKEACSDVLDQCWDVYTNPAIQMASAVSYALEKGNVQSDDFDDTMLKQLIDVTFLEEISVYDRNGENVYTTADHVGYPLSKEEDSDQYTFWELLSGDKDHILVRSSANNNLVYCAIKRTDDVGIIVLSFSDAGFADLDNKLSSKSIVSNFDYKDHCLFMDQQEPDIIYQIDDSGKTITYSNSDFPVVTNKETFCGFRTFNGERYFVVGIGNEDHSLFYLSSISEILRSVLFGVMVCIIFLIIACLLDLLGCAVYSDDSVLPEATEKKVYSHRIMSRLGKRVFLTEELADSQKVLWRHCLYGIMCLITVTLFLDSLLSQNSLLKFLLGNSWEKGWNIFAISLIFLTCLAAFVISRIVRFIFTELQNTLPPRSATACQMAYSIFNIALIVYLVVYSAGNLGIDASTVLASLGITGLALGIAAKDTINDMISGIFIILDGKVQVGDYIEVGGFYGEVTRIGIRTTTVRFENQQKCIDNTGMSNVTNLSRGISHVCIGITLSSNTDLKSLANLIAESTPKFQERCGGKLKGEVKLLAAESFNANSVSCKVIAPVNEGDRKDLTRECNQVLMEILKENDIHFS